MATPTLDEIEANVLRTRAEYQRRETHKLGGAVLSPPEDAALFAVVALVAHVRTLENVTRMTDDKALERITALEAKAAALSAADDVGRAAARAESATSPRMAQKAWAPVAEEMDRLRAENAELRKRVAALTDVPAPAPQWPAPQPIETAPLGRILTWKVATWKWVVETPSADFDLAEWRRLLKQSERALWLPMPPPPGGAK